MNVYFSLGSNIGDREANIKTALAMMDEAFSVRYSALSSIIETEAWGFRSRPFLNCVVLYKLDFDSENIENQALKLLDKLKAIEVAMGRRENIEYDADGCRIYHSRIIDIDILLIGAEKISHPRLCVPHPLMYEREFVMLPLREILGRKDD